MRRCGLLAGVCLLLLVPAWVQASEGQASYDDVPGGANYGLPIAPLPIPFDKCSAAAASDAAMRLTVFAWGYDNQFWVVRQNEDLAGMGAWRSLGGVRFAGGPTVVQNANNDLVVLGRGADRTVWYKVLHSDSTESAWLSLGGVTVGGRVSALIDPQGLLHVFARGSDSAVWEKRQYANGTEAVWGDWSSLGGTVSSNVASLLDAEGLIHVFARGIDGHLWSIHQSLEESGSLAWAPWDKSGGSIYLSSAATLVPRLNAQNLVEVVARGADKAFWHTRQTINDERGVVWAPWKSLGGIFSSAPALQLNADALLTIYGKGPEKGVWYKEQAHHPVDSPSDAWSQWVPLGGRFSSSLEAVPDSRGYINLFGRGLDKSIWTRAQMYENYTVGFFGPWTSLGGRFRNFPC